MTRPLVVACHQPDLLPYTGFWNKMARSDIFVLLPFDQFQKHGYQRRVTMRGHWASHRLQGKPSLLPICEVRVAPGWQDHLARLIRGRYQGSDFWKTRGPDLLGRLTALPPEPDTLDAVNESMIRMMADLLHISTPIVRALPTPATGALRVLRHVLTAAHSYAPTTPAASETDLSSVTYLSGTGALAYMPDAKEIFARSGVEIEWSAHRRRSQDSVLTAYFDEVIPWEAVMA